MIGEPRRPPLGSRLVGRVRPLDPGRQGRRHELVEVAVEHRLGVRRLHVGAQVLDHLVGLQDVGADLVAPAGSRSAEKKPPVGGPV